MDHDKEIQELKNQIEELKGKISNEHPPITQKTDTINTEEKEEFSWEAPVRVFIPWDKQKIVTVLLCIVILSFILIFLQEYLLLMVVVLMTILSISLVIIPPAKTTHKITNKGILTFNKFYAWSELRDFWYGQKKDIISLYIDTHMMYPTKLFFVVSQNDMKQLTAVLSSHLPYYKRREKQNILSRTSDGRYIDFSELTNIQ